MTDDAEKKHVNALEKIIGPVNIINIPFGKYEDEIWEIFNNISEAIPENSELIVDITHGFRSQPLIVIAVLLYLRAVKNITINKILYGAFEAKDENGIAPVFDLKPFLDIIEWTYAVSDIIDYGKAKRINKLLTETRRETFIKKLEIKAESSGKIGSLLDEISNSMSLIRTKHIFGQINRLRNNLKVIDVEIANIPKEKPFGLLLSKINTLYADIPQTEFDIFSYNGIKAQLSIVERLIEIENYQQAITLLREVIVSYNCLLNNLNSETEREKSEKKLGSDLQDALKNKTNFEKYPILDLWQSAVLIRNDINHAAMNQQPCNASSLINNIRNLHIKTKKFIESNRINNTD